MAILDDPTALEPSDGPLADAETGIASALARGTLANVSAVNPNDQEPKTALTTAEGPAIRDAQGIAARIAADEAAADAARELFATDGIPAIDPVTGYARVGRSGEPLHAVRYNAILERGATAGDTDALRGGTVFLTASRLLHAGAQLTEVSLGEIDEMVVALERLVLIQLRDGSDMAIEVDQPRLLRVQIAAAIAALRAAATPSYAPGSGSVDSK